MNQSQSMANISSVPMSQPSIDQKQLYALQLNQQIELARQKKIQEKQQERLLDVKMMFEGNQFGKAGGGAPLRDNFGNIMTTRRNPFNPNYQSADFTLPMQQSMVVQPSQDQIQQLQRSQMPQMSMPQLPQMSMPQLNMPQLPIYQDLNPLQEQEKRQRQMILQRELLQQIEHKDRAKKEDKLREKLERELDDQRIINERRMIEARMRDELGIEKLEMRNLQETNFDIERQRQLKRIEALKLQNDLLEQQNKKNATHKPARQRSPEYYRNNIDQERIEQRIIRELPIEVEKTVRDTVNVELQRLRQEMNLSSNQVSEQIVQLKGSVMKANEARHYSEDQLRKLKEELKQTQIIDEIRQRELYAAFMQQQKTRQIIESTQRLMTPETVKFTFPKRPRPYYNYADPYLGTNDEVNRDIHQILTDQTNQQPLPYQLDKFGKDDIADKMLYNREEIKEDYRKGFPSDQFDLSDDYLNRQNLYIPKIQRQNQTNNYQPEFMPASIPSMDYHLQEEHEIRDVIQHYDSKLEKLDTLDLKKDLNKMDAALHDLVQQQRSKVSSIEQYKDHFDYDLNNDYYTSNVYDKIGVI